MDKLVLICSFFITVVCIVRCCLSSKKNLSDAFLNISLFSLIIITIVYYLGITATISDYPHFYRLGTLSTFIYMPASFLFVKYTLEKSRFKIADLLLFLPAFVFFIDYLPFFLQSAEYKIQSLQYDIANQTIAQHLQSRWMPPGTYFIIQNILGVALGLMQLRLITHLLKIGGKAYYHDNAHIIQWFAVWSFLLIASCLPDLMKGTMGIEVDIKEYIFVTPCLLLYFLYPLSILINPRLLYGSRGFWISKDKPSKVKQLLDTLSVSQQKLQIDQHINDILGHSLQLLKDSQNGGAGALEIPNDKTYLAEEQATLLKSTLDKIIIDNKIYLMKSLSMSELATAMSIDKQHLASFITHYLGMSYNDLMDTYRIKVFIEHYRLSDNKDISYSAKQAGFDDESKLMDAFKKITGTNPDQYFNQ